MRHLQTFRLIEAVARAGSIRRAAEDMNLTASALNRRIQRFEREFGGDIFERLPRGVRLNAAGELVMQHFRRQQSDLSRVQSLVADLAGVRRGHVTIACSQGLMPYFMPEQIARYRGEYPGVTFSVNVRDRAQAERELATFNSDLALVFEPMHLVDFQILHIEPQPVMAILSQRHPLADKPLLRLRDCLDHSHVMPEAKFGVRVLLDAAMQKLSRTARPVVETDSFDLMRHYVLHEDAVGFQIPIGLSMRENHDLVVRPIDPRDMPPGNLFLGQMRGRVLPVASARFAAQLVQALHEQNKPVPPAAPAGTG